MKKYFLRGYKSHTYIRVLCAAIFLTLVGTLAYFKVHKSNKPHEIQKVTSQKPVTKVDPMVLTSKSVFFGEVFWGRGIDYFAQKSPLKYAFPFAGITDVVHNKYDNWIGDLECPVTTTDVPYQTQVDHLKFNCRPEYLTEAKKWFDVFTLANNHMYDNRASDGQSETRTNLETQGIQYFGDYEASQTDNICEVISFKAKVTQAGQTDRTVRIPIAMCGYMYVVDQTPTLAELDVMEPYVAVMPVIAMPHMGVEYRPTAEEAKVDAYHRMIDAGADAVLATHPHVIQNSENYKGKLIQYSAGNFMFDQQSLGHDNILSLGVGLSLELNDQDAINAYTSVGESCKSFKDTCLTDLQKVIKKRPVFKITYNPECFNEPNYYPVPASADTCQEIQKQSTWQSTVSGLSGSL